MTNISCPSIYKLAHEDEAPARDVSCLAVACTVSILLMHAKCFGPVRVNVRTS